MRFVIYVINLKRILHNKRSKLERKSLFVEYILRQYCEMTGVEYTDKMINWEHPPTNLDETWQGSWFENATTSTGFYKPERNNSNHTKPSECVLPEYVTKAIDDSIPYYEYMYQYRILPPE